MTRKAIPKPRFLTRIKPCADVEPERDETLHLQEQFIGPLPMWTGRPAAEILAERLTESDPAGACPVFIP